MWNDNLSAKFVLDPEAQNWTHTDAHAHAHARGLVGSWT